MQIKVDFKKEIAKLDHFWKSTGFTPAELLLRADMQQALSYYAAVANDGIKHLRIHYLLNLTKASNLEKGSPEYDWSQLDKALDIIINNNLKPFFELMGNPNPDYFNDFSDSEQVHAWKDFVKELALHYIDRYGKEEVRSWYFETSNEPDLGWDWGWGATIEKFCNYYDACSEGLKEADTKLRFGGPGTCQTLSPMFKGILEHCEEGTNFFTGEKGVRIDFISVHEKGIKDHKEDLNPDTLGISEREIQTFDYVRENHPGLTNKPFMNNECDPQVGWSRNHSWRARPYYAAIATKIINQHIQKFEKSTAKYELLSNDNGFMGEWGHRTLLSRFGDKEDFADGKFVLVKKPILTVMTMLALLGDKRCQIEGLADVSSELGAIATTGQDQLAVLIYNSRDKIMSSGKKALKLELSSIPFEKGIIVHYRIDEEHGDPYTHWEKMGAPDKPNQEQVKKMRENQELSSLSDPEIIEIKDGRYKMSFELPLHGVSLVLISKKTAEKPEKVIGLRAEMYKGLLEDKEEILIKWQGNNSKLIKTYQVLYADSIDGNYIRLNKEDLIDNSYIHIRDKEVEKGFYKVVAVDYWDRKGKESEIIEI